MRTDVPWLNHLRRDRRGIYVPVVNRWGPERVENTTVAFDPNVRARAVFCMDQDETEPDFKAQNPQRQRQSMVLGECQVCGRPVPWRRRYLVLSGMSTEVIDWQGDRVTVVTEPWLDLQCATIAIERCPALIRRSDTDDLTLHQVKDKASVDLILSTGWVDGEFAEETRKNPVAMWAKLLIKDLILVAK